MGNESVCVKSTAMPFGEQIFLSILDVHWAPGPKCYCRCTSESTSSSHCFAVLNLRKTESWSLSERVGSWCLLSLSVALGASDGYTWGVLGEGRKVQNKHLFARKAMALLVWEVTPGWLCFPSPVSHGIWQHAGRERKTEMADSIFCERN